VFLTLVLNFIWMNEYEYEWKWQFELKSTITMSAMLKKEAMFMQLRPTACSHYIVTCNSYNVIYRYYDNFTGCLIDVVWISSWLFSRTRLYNGLAPPYLSDDCLLVAEVGRRLRSADAQCVSYRVNETPSLVTGVLLWLVLWSGIVHCVTLAVFTASESSWKRFLFSGGCRAYRVTMFLRVTSILTYLLTYFLRLVMSSKYAMRKLHLNSS